MTEKIYWSCVAALLVLSTVGLFWFWCNQPQIADENGLLENGQAFFLGAAAILSLVLMRGDREPALVWFFFLLFFLSIGLRELEIQKYGLPSLVSMLGSGMGRNLLLGAGWLIFIALFLKNFAWQRQQFASFFFGGIGLVFLGGCFFLAAGFPFDKKCFPFSKLLHQFFEEILELHGSFLLAQIPALGLLARLKRCTYDRIRVSDLDVLLPPEPLVEEDFPKIANRS